jgi:PAS domain-containing protein
MKMKFDVRELDTCSSTCSQDASAPHSTSGSPVSHSGDKNSVSLGSAFESLANLVPEIVFQTDRDGTIIFMNQTGLQAFFHTSPLPLMEIRAETLFEPEDRKRVKR